MKWIMLLAGLGGAAAVGFAALGVGYGGRAEASTYHVNYEAGADQRDGLSPQTAWKHAPGDPHAAGVPARTRLQAGDTVIFAAGVRYRGAILVKDSGEPGRPITFAGARPGGSAVIDGSEMVQAQPCPSAAACGGATQWKTLVRMTLPSAAEGALALFGPGAPLRPAQEPDPSEDFYRNETDDMLEADGDAMSAGRVVLPPAIVSGLAAGGGRLALWVKPNRVVYRPITALDGNTAAFDPTGLKFYIHRKAKAAAVDHVSLIDEPGEYAVLADGATVVAMPPALEGPITVGAGRGGFHVQKSSHVVFRELGFENMSDGGKLPPAGVAIFASKGSADITIENNHFRNFVMVRGQGPIIQRGVEGLKILKNRIDTIVLGSGMRLSGSDIMVEDNDIRRLGRTGVMLIGTRNVTVRGNVIADIRGVHGNGVSAYLDNQNIRFVGNTILDAKQPATFHGAGKKATGDNDILFANNLFIATPDALGSLISWGGKTRGVTIRNNVLLGGRTGLRLDAADTGVTIVDNVSSGLIIADGPPEGWRVEGNAWTQLTFQQKRERPAPRVSIAEQAADAALRRGEAPADVCAVVMRQSLPIDASIGVFSGAVGAQLRCN